MNKLFALILAFSLSTAVHAAAPTPQSIEKLLSLSGAEKAIDAMLPAIDNMMKSAMEKASQGKSLDAEEQKVLDKFREKSVAIVKSELTMDKMKPMYIDIYTKNFTQKEINGLIAFYESSTGKAFSAKMPAVMQAVMADMPNRLNPMMQEMQKATEEMNQELEALRKKSEK